MRLIFFMSLSLALLQAQPQKPEVPTVWDDAALRGMELPIAGLGLPAHHVSSDFYYRIPTAAIPKTYPVYAPDREPTGYFEWLKQQEPQVAVDFDQVRSKEEWIRAGELVFDAPFRPPFTSGFSAEFWREFGGTALYPRTASDGTYPWVRYWVVKKGDVRAGFTECGSCHTRVLENEVVVPGAQGNLNERFTHVTALRRTAGQPDQWIRGQTRLFAAPWLQPDPADFYRSITQDQAIAIEDSVPAGVRVRNGTNLLFPPKIPDLIGIADRKYLDATGLVRHRSIGDLMRYATLVDITEGLSEFNGFRPSGELPDPTRLARFSDKALYALAMYIYSLQPPPNPNKSNDVTQRGQQVFNREGCRACHTPPLFTNNSLTPADGFVVPAEHNQLYDVLRTRVGTDTRLTLGSRKGTGYYRVPSLKGVWYRGPLEHNGSVATLEDWFDPARLRDDYVPTAFVGYGFKTRAVKGHPFGLKLSQEEKQALIAYLRTL